MRLKEIRGLPVVDPTAARKIGTVTDYLVDPVGGRLAALEVTPADGDAAERIPAHRVRRVGQHAVVLTGRAASGGSADRAGSASERWLDANSLDNLEVLGDDGNRVGRLQDATFDQDSLDVQAYLLRGRWWERLFGRPDRIQPSQVASCSRELMIVTSGRLREPEPAPSEDSPETARLGVPLKLEDRLPTSSSNPTPVSPTPVEDGPAVSGRRRRD